MTLPKPYSGRQRWKSEEGKGKWSLFGMSLLLHDVVCLTL